MGTRKEKNAAGANEKKTFVDRRRLGELLVETGLLTRDRLKEALDAQKGTGRRLGQVLVEREMISEDEMAFALAMQLKVPFIDLSDYEITGGVIEAIPEEVCRKFICIPIEKQGNLLHVSMADPLDLNMMKEIRFITGFNIQPAISTATQILDRLQKHYHPEKSITDVTDELAREELLEFYPEEEEVEAETELDNLQDSPFVKMVDLIIRNAIQKGASDVHIEAQENHVRVRNRIDGVLQESIKLPKWTQPIIISRIKVLGGMDIAERRLPQDGRIKVKAKNFSADLRVSTLPTFYGEKAVIRILNKQEAFRSLSDIGFGKENLAILRRFIRRPQGMILITGPTGSGKTSTLYACLSEIRSDEVNLITVEDPVEYELPGINQVQINEKVGLDFPTVLRGFLRHDPDIILVGETRDAQTAKIAMEAAITGHLVLTSMHTNSALGSVVRLKEMGVDPFLVANALSGVIAQRLVRRSCPVCSKPHKYIDSVVENLRRVGVFGPDEQVSMVKGEGCPNCNNTGFRGRVGVFEVLQVTEELKNLIAEDAPMSRLKEEAKRGGMVTLSKYAGFLLKNGLTVPSEILRVLSRDG